MTKAELIETPWIKFAEGTFYCEIPKGTLIKSITIIGVGNVEVSMVFVPEKGLFDKPKQEPNHYQNLIDDVCYMEWSVRVSNVFKENDIKTLFDLVKCSPNELLKFHRLGRRSLNEIQEVLAQIGLSLGLTEEEFNDWMIKHKETGYGSLPKMLVL